MSKIDFKKELKHLYSASAKQPTFVDVPKLNYLSIDGAGDPNTSGEYQQAVQALFSLAYTIKFAIKKGATGIDYAVMPLQGQWWVDDMRQFSVARKEEWQWTLMIMQPPLVTEDIVKACREVLAKKKDLASLAKVQFAAVTEGKAAQILHIGPFSDEGPTIARLHRFIEESGASLAGKHHEIYLSDIRRAAPARWKTIIRQPVK